MKFQYLYKIPTIFQI